MIDSIYLIDRHGQIIIEKHWRSHYGSVALNQFIKYWQDYGAAQLKPVTELSNRYVGVHIERAGLVFLCLVSHEVSPFVILEFLEKFHQVLLEYFAKVNEDIIKENFVTVARLLEEMLDYGYPLTTDPNVLRDMVPVPNLVSKVMQSVTGASGFTEQKPGVGGSLIPWRKAGIKYSSNEIYIDIVEEIDLILEPNGAVTLIDIAGKITSNCLMSGTPDLTLTFTNPHILDDVSFHPCVRLKKFEANRAISFIPPDGHFKLATYRVSDPRAYQPPLWIRAAPGAVAHSDTLQKLTVSLETGPTGGKPLTDVTISIVFTDQIGNISARTDQGSTSIDARSRVGTSTFEIGTVALSGLRIHSLKLTGEHYQFFK
ncbi:hypothetical protein H4R33_004805, partial [Dimargaris cristalligena]